MHYCITITAFLYFPIQVSLDLMTRDAIRFFVIFFIIYLAFGSGITELYAPFGVLNNCCCDAVSLAYCDVIIDCLIAHMDLITTVCE